MKNLLILAALTGPLFGSPITASAQARRFEVKNDGGSRIQFVSDAPLETITGVTSHVSGEVQGDPANLGGVRGRVEVRIASLRTGVDLRDEHLRGESWLDATRFQNASFEITRVEGASSLRPNEPANVRVRGRFTLHGVTKDITAQARVQLVPMTAELGQTPGITGDVLRVQATFTIRLTDYNISVPLPIRLKVANEIQVDVNLRGIAAAAAAPAAARRNP